MQFPILQAGRPFTGERAMIPGVAYSDNESDFWMKLCREAWEFYQTHPDGPYSYSAWDYVPGRPEVRPTHAYWLKQYMPLVEEGTCAWLEAGDCTLFDGPLPAKVVVSAFANRDVYLVIANYAEDAVEVTTKDTYVSTITPDAPRQHWKVAGRSLEILRLHT
jgi:hypothetical protein